MDKKGKLEGVEQAAVTSLNERRGTVRRRALKGARVSFDAGNSTRDCVVRNFSEQGAKLVFELTTGVPDLFDLHISDGTSHPCRVKWRTLNALGVEFYATLKRVDA